MLEYCSFLLLCLYISWLCLKCLHLRAQEYATEDELQQPAGDTNAASASLPAWAWATVPNRKIQMTVPY
jgi:hypothetical protein